MYEAALEICRRARDNGLLVGWQSTPDLGATLAAGPDIIDFLHSQLTSNVKDLNPGQGQLSARLTRTGALAGAFSLHRLPEHGQPFPTFLLILPRGGIPALMEDLQAYVVTEDVVFEDVSDDFTGWIVQGPDAQDVVTRVCGPMDDLPPGRLALARSFAGDTGWLILESKGGGPTQEAHLDSALIEAADQAGLVRLDSDQGSQWAWDWLRIEAGWPLAGRDYQPGKIPLPQTGLEQQLVSSTKGCYLGQEVVARLRTYGSVPRAMRGLIFAGEPMAALADLPEAGGDLLDRTGKKIGTWASSGLSVVWDAPIALAFLDRDHRTPGSVLDIELAGRQVQAQVVLLPFYQAADNKKKARSLHTRAVHLFSRGDDGPAVELLEEALRLDPEHRDSFEALGVILGRAEKYHEAIDIFRRLEEVAPDEPMVHTNLSLFYMKIGDKEEAEKQSALGTLKRMGGITDPASLQRQEADAKVLRQQDALRKKGMYNEVLAVDPEDPLALMGLGNALAELEEFNEAATYLGRACALEKDNSPLYASLGKVLEKLERFDAAAEVYRRGVAVASRRGDLMPLKDMEHRLLLLEAVR